MCFFKSNPDSVIFIPRRVNLDYIYRSQLTSIVTNCYEGVIHGRKTRYMLCSKLYYLMCSFRTNSNSIIFIPRRVNRDYMYTSQLTVKGTNRHAKENGIHGLKKRYRLFSRIKHHMFSFNLDSNSIIFIPRRVKARLYLYFTINFNRNESSRVIKPCYSRSENPIYGVLKSNIPSVFFQNKIWFGNIYSPTC
jgi:hypothetical protein